MTNTTNHETGLRLEKSSRSYYRLRTLPLMATRLGMQLLSHLSTNWAASVSMKMFSTPLSKTWKGDPPAIFQTAGVHFITTSQGPMKLYSWGLTGPRVLLVHGWQSRAFAFAFMISYLVERGYRVVAIDGPAHGESSGRSTNLVRFGEAIQSVIDSYELAGGIKHVVGHSFGAASAVFQLARPEMDNNLESLALINMPTKMSRFFHQFGKVLGLSDQVVEQSMQLVYQKVGTQIDALDLSTLIDDIPVDRILTLQDQFDPVLGPEHWTSVGPVSPKHTIHLTKGLGHNRILKDPETLKVLLAHFRNESGSQKGSTNPAVLTLDQAG